MATDEKIPESDKKSLGMKAKMYALGGIATKASIFGEKGPEMAIPLNHSPRSFELLRRTAQILGVQNQGYEPGTLSTLNQGQTNAYAPGSLSQINGSQMIQFQQHFKMPDIKIDVIVNEAKSSKEDISAKIKEAVESAMAEFMEVYFSGKERLAYGE